MVVEIPAVAAALVVCVLAQHWLLPQELSTQSPLVQQVHHQMHQRELALQAITPYLAPLLQPEGAVAAQPAYPMEMAAPEALAAGQHTQELLGRVIRQACRRRRAIMVA